LEKQRFELREMVGKGQQLFPAQLLTVIYSSAIVAENSD
jgi:hypothetical protein